MSQVNKSAAQPMNKLTPADVVMRSLQSGQDALDSGDAEQALRILSSVNELCKKSEAPPTVHGLTLRMLGDALLANGMYDESRAALKQGIAMNESAEKNPQLPVFLLKDVQGRLADLYAALGELERKTENYKQSLSALRTAVEYFGNLDNPDYGVATLHRVGLVLVQKGDYKDAIKELEEAAVKTEKCKARDRLLAANFRHQADAYEALGDMDKNKEMLERSLATATAGGDANLIEELNAKLCIGDNSAEEENKAAAGEDVFL